MHVSDKLYILTKHMLALLWFWSKCLPPCDSSVKTKAQFLQSTSDSAN